MQLKQSLGSTDIVHQAMLRGEVDLYPEYTGTGLQIILHIKDIFESTAVYQAVKQGYEDAFNFTWLTPYGFDNTQALAVREDTAQRLSLTTISDLQPYAPQLTIAGLAEFSERPDGLVGLTNTYDLNFLQVKQLEQALLYEAIYNEQVDVIVAFSTNGRISEYNLVLLEDDKQLFPAYDAATVIRQQTLAQYPELKPVLNKLAGAISAQQMQRLNYLVDIANQSPPKVAHDFLLGEGLI